MRKNTNQNLQLLLIAGVLVVINLFASSFFLRVDLTKEKRYSLSDVSIETMDTLQYPIYATVYLEGDFPPNIREFQDALETTLTELAQYSHGYFDFEFIDPSNNTELLRDFASKGFQPVPVTVRVNATETRQQFMWPIAVFRSREKEQYVDLLRGATLPNGAVDFVKAESDLEYKLVSVVRNVTRERRGIVGLLRGHGEWTDQQINEFGSELYNSYNLVDYDQKKRYPGVAISPDIDVMLVLQPTQPFSERDKYELDQYLMRGGKLVFALNQTQVDLDLFNKRSTLTELRSLNLDDLFLKYGLKVNYDMVLDFNSETTELFMEGGNGGSFVSKKWPFYPLVRTFPSHPVTRNVEGVLLRYASSIDTLPRQGIKHTVFLTSSPRSRTMDGRQFIDVNQVTEQPIPPSLFNKGPQVVGVITEGVFQSLFVGREAPVDSLAPEPPTARFGPQNNPSAPGVVAVVGDGEIIRPRFFRGDYTTIPFDNKTLMMNLVDYLGGDEALTRIRSKEVVIRQLSREKVLKNASVIRWANVVIPVALVALFGVARAFWRKRRHAAANRS
jgi:ABC-2 type transport system permease protein